MPLPLPAVEREPIHRRRVIFEGYRRSDGLWDIEACLVDLKSRDFRLQSGVRPAGLPVHEMWLRLTIDARFTIVAATASSDAFPYPDCHEIAPAYGRLVGLNLLRGFRRALRERFGGVRGCTHLTELLGHFPTVAIQTFAGEHEGAAQAERKPFQLDQCHALETSSETVRRYYPKWYRGREGLA
jgi:hypothetical protein